MHIQGACFAIPETCRHPAQSQAQSPPEWAPSACKWQAEGAPWSRRCPEPLPLGSSNAHMMTSGMQAATAGVGAELKALRQQRDALEDQIQRLEASILRARSALPFQTPVHL